nr:AbrB family transcriptional regulator [Streptomyces sp. HNM0575]
MVAGAAGGLLLTWLRVPAGTLVGAVLGSAAAGTITFGGVVPGRAAGRDGHGRRTGTRPRQRQRQDGQPDSPPPRLGPGSQTEPPPQHPLQHWARTAGLVLIGCVSAARLDGKSLRMMGLVALPVLAGVVLLLALDAVLARWLMRRHGLDATTAVLACAPGGLSELSVLAVKERADVGTVTVVHLVRVLVVVLLALPGLVLVLGRFT